VGAYPDKSPRRSNAVESTERSLGNMMVGQIMATPSTTCGGVPTRAWPSQARGQASAPR
jgi:hypothetical protein